MLERIHSGTPRPLFNMNIICASLLAFVTQLGASTGALAQQPVMPPLIKIIVPFGPGASTDVFARAVASQLGPRLNTTVIVENRPGGSTLIGAAAVAKGPRDGSMLLLTTPSTVTAAATVRHVPFNMSTDLVPVSMLGEGPMVVAVSAKSAFKTPAALIAAARAKPGSVTYGTSGSGTLAHLSFELLADAGAIEMQHIPYKGASFGLVDLASGTIDMMVANYSTFAAQIKAGLVLPLGVTSRHASSAFPTLPPMASVAPGFAVDIWATVFAAGGTPLPILQRLNAEINEIALSREMRALMATDSQAPMVLGLADLRYHINDNYATWKRLAAAKKIVAE
ncbi:tripartite tricarboxylate transporter substrate binding protein [Variovorax saccharolyticus]|uniref:tripartite tricarboxylate transporter substrate binding protein n=1 Tax=Variovorax saccharolyticus TaxID=3053516 RepID=UPI002577D605|nr:tripartite tricarboxylate transporter substrate binding protein [Variovorax sp. J22R187]MDM0022219.1 tripartite tricarboxylate transporter substrate binding protein [Variovorax sp. J22R187]